jgi:glycosyltransferase involved in cell wall biosynthesis
VRILAMMEAASVTGPAKNLIGFCQWLKSPEGARTGLTVAIATFDRNARTNESDSFVAAAQRAGIETHLIRERRRFDLGVIPQLREIAAATAPDIIQTHNGKSHLLIRSLPDLRRGRLWFAFEHGQVFSDLKLRLLNQADRLSLRAADRVISVCSAFTPRLEAYGVKNRRIRILHNAAVVRPAVAETERSALRQRLGIGGRETVVLTIGRLSREKGHADLLTALARTSMTGDWKLVLVGIGPEREALGRLASALGIAGHIVFAGFQQNVAPFFAIADLFVLPSHSEGSSNVLLEAMAARVPIVATAAGGNPEIVLDARTGLLVPVRSPGALAAAMAGLLQDRARALRFSESGYARAVNEFSVEQYRQRLAGYYAEALEGLRCAS